MTNRPTNPQQSQKIGSLVTEWPVVGPWSERSDWSNRLGQAFVAWFAMEVENRRLFLWLPVGMMIGVTLYAGADQEPLWQAGLMVASTLGYLAYLQRYQYGALFYSLVMLTSVAVGFTAASLQTWRVSQPVLKTTYFGYVTGWIEEIEWRDKGARLILRVESLYYPHHDTAPTDHVTPKRIRVTATQIDQFKAGDRIRSAVRLQPPPGPTVPGGYDFRIDSYFKQIGAVGTLNGPLKLLRSPELTTMQSFWTGLDNLRNHITRRITSIIKGQEGAVGAALVTGKRGTIDDSSNDILRAAGIYHVISISGLHMAIAAGFAFATARILLLLIPGLVLRTDIRRWSALAGIIGAILYDLFAGSDIATERSMLMSMVFFGAIVAGRRLLSMRNCALAACILVLVEPQGVMNPGFQMSFAAVAALIACYEKRPNFAGFEVNHPKQLETHHKESVQSSFKLASLTGKGLKIATDIILTTLVAEMATAPFGLFHFHMVQTYGIIGNAITLPFVSFIVMPAAFIGMILLPFGWDGPVWQVMGFGVHGVLEASRLIASWPYATLILPGFDAGALIWLAGGLAFLTLFLSPLRWIGLVLAVVGIATILVNHHHYAVLISREGRFIAARGRDGLLVFTGTGINSFSVSNILRDDGDNRSINDRGVIDNSACDANACRLPLSNGRKVMLVLPKPPKNGTKDPSKTTGKSAKRPDPLSMTSACAEMAVIILPDTAPWSERNRSACQALLITPDQIKHQGPLALSQKADGTFVLYSHQSPTQERPWITSPQARAPKPQ